MGSIFQVLIVIGIIVFAIVKQASDSAEKKKKQAKAGQPNPSRQETAMGDRRKAVPPPFLSHDYEQPEPLSSLSTDARRAKSSIKTNSPSGNMAPPSPPMPENPDAEPEFDISSTEDVRRGIIWSEILNRKY